MRYASGTRKPENRRTASTSVFENLVEEGTLRVIDNCVRPTGNHESSSRRRKGLENGFSKRENAGMEWNGIAMLGNLGDLLEDKWLVNDNCVIVQADVKTYRNLPLLPSKCTIQAILPFGEEMATPFPGPAPPSDRDLLRHLLGRTQLSMASHLSSREVC